MAIALMLVIKLGSSIYEKKLDFIDHKRFEHDPHSRL